MQRESGEQMLAGLDVLINSTSNYININSIVQFYISFEIIAIYLIIPIPPSPSSD